MTQSEIATRLYSIHLKEFVSTIKAYNDGDTFTITVHQKPNESLSDFIERSSGVTKRLGMGFIVIGSEDCYQGNYSSEIEFTYGFE
jgi:hypothetical protein